MAIARPIGPPWRALLLGLAAGLASAAGIFGQVPGDDAAAARAWIDNPGRHFATARALPPGRALLLDEASDPELESALTDALRRLFSRLYGGAGWRNPFAEGEPLRLYVARRPAAGERRMIARGRDRGRLTGPAILLDATELTRPQIVHEVGRLIALATLAGYGVPPDDFLTPAAAEYLASGSESLDEEAWTRAAAPLIDFRSAPAAFGRLWVEEAVREAGSRDFLREVWEKASGNREAALPTLLRMLPDLSPQIETTLLARAAARVFVALEPEASPSRLRLLDLESGALDAAAPASLTVRHRSFLPDNMEETIRFSWPEDGSAGAAVVRYRDPALPPDVVFFAPGDRRAIPLSGVGRIDWLVAGAAGGGGDIRMPVLSDRSPSIPYTGLDARVLAGVDGPRLNWTTASHEGLWGWAVFREEVLPDGRVARTGPEIVPSSESSSDSFRYAFVDRAAVRGTFYRYTVWAVTDEGLLARAFSATLKTAD